eukprot:gene4516-14677_t
MAEVANRGELLRNADRIDWENAGEPMWDVEEAVMKMDYLSYSLKLLSQLSVKDLSQMLRMHPRGDVEEGAQMGAADEGEADPAAAVSLKSDNEVNGGNKFVNMPRGDVEEGAQMGADDEGEADPAAAVSLKNSVYMPRGDVDEGEQMGDNDDEGEADPGDAVPWKVFRGDDGGSKFGAKETETQKENRLRAEAMRAMKRKKIAVYRAVVSMRLVEDMCMKMKQCDQKLK